MKLYQERVIAEKKELDNRLEKLRQFKAGDPYERLDPDEKQRMFHQEKLMSEYSEILAERIIAFSD